MGQTFLAAAALFLPSCGNGDEPTSAEAEQSTAKLQDDEAWDAALASGTIDAAERYLEAFPDGRHAAAASQHVHALTEARHWAEALKARTTTSLELFLRQHPDGAHRAEAEHLLAILREMEDWLRAKGAGTVDAYEDFLSRYPLSEHAPEAAVAAEALREDRSWGIAREANTIESVSGYLSLYPEGAHIVEAHSLLFAMFDGITVAGTFIPLEGFIRLGPNGIPESYPESTVAGLTLTAKSGDATFEVRLSGSFVALVHGIAYFRSDEGLLFAHYPQSGIFPSYPGDDLRTVISAGSLSSNALLAAWRYRYYQALAEYLIEVGEDASKGDAGAILFLGRTLHPQARAELVRLQAEQDPEVASRAATALAAWEQLCETVVGHDPAEAHPQVEQIDREDP